MARRFHRTRRGLRAHLDDVERDLLVRLFDDVARMLQRDDVAGGADPGGADPGGADPGGADPGGADPGGADEPGADVAAAADEVADDARGQGVDPLVRIVGLDLGEEATVRPPQDPAVARLLPDAHPDDAAASGEFRRYTEHGLRDRKREGLRTASATLRRDGPLLLDEAEAAAWVVALTDVRLVLAERLGIRDDDDAMLLHHSIEGLGPDDPRTWLAAVYELLTWLQETLVEALLPS